ncbi:hypothetical protein NGB36_00435 [Streptomyces sp. RB6PN25]|uniref:Transposase n=1 Tax=Streptomyces humicola TaxID=2953240 RepID=A0ABT1PQB4_9ACTN|nr:hypothetical protein [Streptomyces humicola]MCQ4079120.1 hypothetical protein [Streptomyces humicola]
MSQSDVRHLMESLGTADGIELLRVLAQRILQKLIEATDDGYLGTGLVIPHRRKPGRHDLPPRQQETQRLSPPDRARVEHVFV